MNTQESRDEFVEALRDLLRTSKQLSRHRRNEFGISSRAYQDYDELEKELHDAQDVAVDQFIKTMLNLIGEEKRDE